VSYLSKNKKAAAPAAAIKVKLPDVRQETSYSCGASAFQAIAEMYGVGPQEESWYRDALDTDPEKGTQPDNIRELADQLGLQTIAKQKMTADDLKKWLDQGVPVLILIQAWGDPAGYEGMNDGHYVVAIGYTDDDLIVEDPSLRLTRGFIAWDSLDKRWHDAGVGGAVYDHWGMAVIKHEVMREVKGFSLNGNGKHLHKQGQEWW
jgi:predicted double-glycine peptidase